MDLKKKSIRAQILTKFSLTFLLIFLILLAEVLLFSIRVKRFIGHKKDLRDASLAMAESQNAEKSFLLQDTKMESFFQSSNSDYLNRADLLSKVAMQNISKLTMFLPDKKEAQSLVNEIQTYNQNLAILKEKFLKFGFYRSGVYGQLKNESHYIQNYLNKSNAKAENIFNDIVGFEDKTLYFIPFDKNLLFKKLALLNQKVESSNQTDLIPHIENYQNLIKTCLLITNEIGRTDESGVRKSIQSSLNIIVPKLNDLIVYFDVKTVELKNQDLYLELSLFLFLFIGGIFVFNSFSNGLFNSINDFKQLVLNMSKGDLDVDLSMCPANTSELNDLAYAFLTLSLDLKKTMISKDHVEDIYNAISDAVIVINIHGAIVKVNKAADNLFVNYPIINLDQIKTHLTTHCDQAINNNELIHNMDCDLTFKDQIIPVLITYSPIFSKDPEFKEFVLIIKNISKQKENEMKIQEQTKMLFQAAKMQSLGEMASGIAHEINNPLSSIGNLAELITILAESDLKDKDPKLLIYANQINKLVFRTSKIIKGLKIFAREGENDPHQDVPVKSVLNEALTLCESKLKNSDIDLSVNQNHLDEIISCNPTQIAQVILNLMNNSFDEIKDNSEKWINFKVTKPNDSKIEIRVTDSGKGISDKVAERLFQPFFTTKEVGKGTGLGLSISKGLIELHHGTLTVDKTSKNTCFVITLPQKQKPKV
jgi:signal transduction histidine kinase